MSRDEIHEFPAVIIGRGPAGLSAAIYLARAGYSPLVVGEVPPLANYTISNYLGFPNPIKGSELLESAEEQARRFGAQFIEGRVLGCAKFAGKFSLSLIDGDIQCSAVILAVGAQHPADPKVGNLEKFLKRGISRCAICDAHSFRGSRVVVLGAGDYAASEALVLSRVAAEVTVVSCETDFRIGSRMLASLSACKVRLVRSDKVELRGAYAVDGVAAQGSGVIPADGVFIAVGEPSSRELALKLGVKTNSNGFIAITCETCETSVDGIFAAGDCTGILRQVAAAVGQGAVAGTSAAGHLRELGV